uniref:Uncharacterized protein n=1 Tax=Arundo donax TaxID=35708 RepID=A0A0A9A6B6_ARUDO
MCSLQVFETVLLKTWQSVRPESHCFMQCA